MLRAGLDAAEQTEAGDRTPGTLGDAVFGVGGVDHDRRTIVFIDDSRCDNADYAGVPVLACQDDALAVGVVHIPFDDHFTGLLENLALALRAWGFQLLEIFG